MSESAQQRLKIHVTLFLDFCYSHMFCFVYLHEKGDRCVGEQHRWAEIHQHSPMEHMELMMMMTMTVLKVGDEV